MAKKKPRRKYVTPLQLRVTPEQIDMFRRAAERDGRALSNWARDRLLTAAKHELNQAGAG